jgi:hypothetical protein
VVVGFQCDHSVVELVHLVFDGCLRVGGRMVVVVEVVSVVGWQLASVGYDDG